jgi:hypothetical protein
MKLLDAAVLTVVGWILILPPLVKEAGQFSLQANATVADWQQMETFDTSAACEQKRQSTIDCGKVLNGDKPGTTNEACGHSTTKRTDTKDKAQADLIAGIAKRKMAARCVSDTDPYLKSK